MTFLPCQFFKKLRIYHVWFLFGATPSVDSYLRHFEAINEKQNREQNLNLDVFY